jgi:hypothetical protein
MDNAQRATILDAIRNVRGRTVALPIAGLDLLLVGRAGNNYVLLLPQGDELTEAEKAWLDRWHGCAEVVRDAGDARSAVEANWRQHGG